VARLKPDTTYDISNVPNDQSIEDLLARLERERLDADRLYNEALTAVDRALRSAPALPEPPPLYDETRLADVNASWDILPGGAPSLEGNSFKDRLRRFVWRLIGPSLETQKRFNAALVDHLNRNAAAHRESAQAVGTLLRAVGREWRALERFESLLVQYLQTITVYVDSKDRSLGGSDIRQRLALTEQRLLALKRDVERGEPRAGAADGREATAFSGSVDSVTYVQFEDHFRGSQHEISTRVEDYVPFLGQSSDIVDIGCGRGELLALLNTRGISARGVDSNAAMVELCRSRGLNVEQGDGLSYLQRQADNSIGGLTAIQVVEHFAPAYLVSFLETAFHKMRPGAPLLLETINPACWMAFFDTYLRDLTHRQPLHPDTLKHLVQACGFTNVDVQFRAPVAEADRLDKVSPPPGWQTGAADPARQLSELAEAINAHADKLNRLLFSSMDYVIVARR
jgi:2-polyprenyl-3-methyl-5-hydroxy-6-metoxy-1,4-benzoquinol methylase